VLSSVIEPFDGRVSAATVWIPMLPDDSAEAATRSSALFGAATAQFYDAERLLGNAIASSIGAATTAWDIYLTYDREQRWKTAERPPTPVDYAHQLGDWADPTRCHTGDRLVSELRRMALSVA
jgi:hypothetical protein